MKRILNHSFPRVIAGVLTLTLFAPNSAYALRPMGVDNAGLEEGLRQSFLGAAVPTVTRVPFGEWEQSINRWLSKNGVLERETEHLGEGEFWTRLIILDDSIPLVELLVDEDWVDQQPAMKRLLSESSVPTKGGMRGRPLVQLVVNRYRQENGQEALLIERVQILRGPKKLKYGEELEIRSELVELMGRWGKENGIPVYLIRPEVMRDANPALSESTIHWNYYEPVNQRNPRLWETVSLRVFGSTFLSSEDQEDPWFRYVGDHPVEEQRSGGLEEVQKSTQRSRGRPTKYPDAASVRVELVPPVDELMEAATRRASLIESRLTAHRAGSGFHAPRAVVVEVAGLADAPDLLALIVQSGKADYSFKEWILLWGVPPKGVSFSLPLTDSISTFMRWLADLETKSGVTGITFLGSDDEANRLKVIAQKHRMNFTVSVPSSASFLAAWVLQGMTTQEPTAGLEERVTWPDLPAPVPLEMGAVRYTDDELKDARRMDLSDY